MSISKRDTTKNCSGDQFGDYDQNYQSDPSFVGGHPSSQGGSPFAGGHPSTHDPSFMGGHTDSVDQQSTLSCRDSSSVKGHPSTQDGSTHSRGDSSFIGGHPSTQDEHPRGDSSFVVAATQVPKPNTPQATPLLWEAVQVLKKAMDSQTRLAIPHLEFLPTLQDRLPLTPVSIIADRDSK